MPNNTNIDIIFRNKFREHIQCDAEHDVFLDAFKKFLALDSETAINMLWQLTYEPHSEVLWKIGLYPESIPEEMTRKLRDELRYQYDKQHPKFLSVEVANECRDAFSALSKQTDIIVVAVVYEHCSTHLYVGDMARMLFLLSSDKDNHHFGGIRCLGFNMQEAEYLKPFHMQIHDLLKAMYELHQKQSSFSEPLNTPFEGLSQRIEEAGIDLPFEWDEPTEHECPVEEPVQAESTFKSLTPEEVLESKDVFASFVQSDDLNTLLKIGQLGFDLNQVMAKKEVIGKLLDANEAHLEAQANLLNAMAANDKASENLLKAAEALRN